MEQDNCDSLERSFQFVQQLKTTDCTTAITNQKAALTERPMYRRNVVVSLADRLTLDATLPAYFHYESFAQSAELRSCARFFAALSWPARFPFHLTASTTTINGYCSLQVAGGRSQLAVYGFMEHVRLYKLNMHACVSEIHDQQKEEYVWEVMRGT